MAQRTWVLLPLWICITIVQSFPESQDPFSAGPPIPRSQLQSCQINLFQNATLNTFDTVSKFPYSPANCYQNETKWGQVILEVKGSIAGVQFDRAGALWLAGVELLRMTTPEPTKSGITWNAERDVTVYGSLFQQESEVHLQIPNSLDSEFNGIIYLSAQLVFYKSQEASSVSVADHVASLTNPVQYGNAWASMAICGNQSMSVNVTSLPKATKAHIDLYASAHDCEEFWYSNPPDNLSQQYGMCGGGSTRQIQLLIDGQVAGSQPPFPVIYTGGINPLLWRPQTGIYSFNIPPYFFDITPFLGILSDGKTHEISISILGNNSKGAWHVHPVLVVFQDHESTDSVQRFGSLIFHQFSQQGPKHSIANSPTTAIHGMPAENVTWVEEYQSELIIESGLPGGGVAKLWSKSTSLITNTLVGDTLQVTSVVINGSMSSSSYDRVDQYEYPLKMALDEQQTRDTFFVEAKVEQGMQRSLHTYSRVGEEIRYETKFEGHAAYNRSTDWTIFVKDGSSHQVTSLLVANDPCWVQSIGTIDGYVTFFDESYNGSTCLPASFCSMLDSCSPTIANTSTTLTTS